MQQTIYINPSYSDSSAHLSFPTDTDVLDGRTMSYSCLYAWPLIDMYTHIQ